MATLLQQAIDLAKSGNRAEAETLLQRILADQPDNEAALMWLSGVSRDNSIKQDALQKALALNPNNELAKRGLDRFGGVPPAASPPSAETITPPPAIDPSDASSPEETSTDLSFLMDDEPETPLGVPETSLGVPETPPDPPEASPFSSSLFGEEQESSVPDLSDEPEVDLSFLSDTEASPALDFGQSEPTSDASEEPAIDLSFLSDTDSDIAADTSSAVDEASSEPAFSFLTDEGDGDADPFNFSFDDETPSPTDPVDTKTENALEWGDFNFEDDAPFNFDLDASEDVPVASDSAPADTTTGDEDTFNFDFFETTETTEPAAEPTTEQAATDNPLSNLFSGEAESSPATTTDGDDDFAFDWDNASSFDLETTEAAPNVEPGDTDTDEAFDLLSRLGSEEDGTTADADITFDEAAIAKDDPISEADSAVLAKQRQQQQQGMLILGVAIFVFLIMLAAALWIFDDVVGRYTILPPPAQLTRQASSPNSEGLATMNFNGYPATSATVRWTPDNEALTCQDPGIGLVVYFESSDPSRLSNQLCTGNSCVFEKTGLSGEGLTELTVGYQCGRDAQITLSNSLQ